MSRFPFLPSRVGGGSWRALLALLSLLVAAPSAGHASPSSETLTARAQALTTETDRALREGGRPFEEIRADLVAVATQLEAARLDTLAGRVRLDAARLLQRQGRGQEAEKQIAIVIADALRGRNRRQELHARIYRAEVRAALDPAGAIDEVHRALPELRKRRDDELLGDALSTEAHALMELGQFADALPLARAAAAHHRASGNEHDQMLDLAQMSQAMRFTGRHPEARAAVDSIIATARRTSDGIALSRGLLESASLYRTRTQYDEALAAANEALTENRRRGDPSGVRSALMFRARIFSSLGRPEACASDLDTLLATPEVQRSFSLTARIAAMQSRALLAMGQTERADALLTRTAERYERFRAGLEEDEERAGTGEHVDEVYSMWARTKLAKRQVEQAWQVAERGHGTALEGRLGAAGVPALAAVESRLRRTNAALLEYGFPDPEQGNILLVTGDGVQGFTFRTRIAINDLRAVMDAASTAGTAPASDSAAARLAQTLLGEVWGAIGPGIERLVIVSPTRLESLPFELLPSPTGDVARLGDRFAISYVASAGAFMALDARAVPSQGITVVADPRIDARQRPIARLDPALRGTLLRPLPGAREEARRLAEPGATMLIGRDATVDRLRASGPAAVLHFATHAFEDPKSASGGGLVLAGRDPLLSPAEVESLGVRADLVTLSGCGTLGTTAFAGEGTFGLARAFLVAGARTVIGTRWNVSDRAAARFMQEFYGALRAGAARDAAVRQARKQLLAEGFPPRDCWAFVSLGVADVPVPLWSSRGSRGPQAK